MASGASRKMYGAVNGTGANIDVKTVGFRPKHVKLLNVTGLARGEWSESMADAAVVKTVTAGTMSFATSGGITPLADGFRIGTDGDLNVASEVIHWVASD